MKLSDLCKAALITYDASHDMEITGIEADSREVHDGNIFVCIRGGERDGHDYLSDAVARGAAVIITEQGVSPEACADILCIETENTRLALSHLLEAWYESPSQKLKIIAVTGTNGKTSTVCMLNAIFRAAGFKTGIIGTLYYKIGDEIIDVAPVGTHSFTTPEQTRFYRVLAAMVSAGVEYAFIEASSHALSQYRIDGAKIEIGIFSNLTPEHLDFHVDMENYFAAKARLFTISDRGMVNIDDQYGRQLALKNPELITYGTTPDCDFYASEIESRGSDGIEYTLRSSHFAFKVNSPIPGCFTVYNTLAAASAALLCGVEPEIVMSALRALQGIDGRMEKVKIDRTKANFTVFIDYAHTPDALSGVLTSIRAFKSSEQRLILLFGCGGERDRTKRREMGRIATRLSDLTIITSDNSRGEEPGAIIQDIMRGIDREKPYIVIENRREAIEYAVSVAGTGDIILLAGKGHEKYEINKSGRHPFDEGEIVCTAVNKYYS